MKRESTNPNVFERKKSADARKAEYDKLTTQQKIEKLDRVLGEGVGAAKQRARLRALLDSEKK